MNRNVCNLLLIIGAVALGACDSTPPSVPTLKSSTHDLSTWSEKTEVTVVWQNNAGSDVDHYFYAFDQSATAEPNNRQKVEPKDGELLATSATLVAGNDHYFHLKACDRNMNCATSHLGPFWIRDQTLVSADDFETGDLSGWKEKD